jgi:CubicO group peptidase (beta-lactamase class C family)
MTLRGLDRAIGSSVLLSWLIRAVLFLPIACVSKAHEPKSVHQPEVRMNALTDEFRAIQKEAQMPGLQISVVEGTRRVFSYVEGLRAVGHSEGVTAEDEWHLGSCTKPMTAFLIGRLIDQKKVAWTTTLDELVPKSQRLHPDLRGVTIEQLLSHRAGLVEVTEPDQGRLFPTLFTDQAQPVQLRDKLVRALLQMPPHFKAGEKSEYSNSGYVVLGWLIDRLAGKPWERTIQDELFATLEMRSCGFGAAGAEDPRNPRQPWSHDFKDGKLVAIAPSPMADNPPALGPAGSVHCSVPDWHKFLRVIVSRDEGLRLVSPATYDKLLSVAGEGPGTYASMGRKERSWAKGPVFMMAGSNTMNYALMLVAPKLGRIYTVNTNAGDDKTEAAATRILKRLTELE